MTQTTGTPGPWFLISSDGTDFTAIATVASINGPMDMDHEVLGSSEWLRVKPADLERMVRVPEMEAEIERLRVRVKELEHGN